MMTTASSGKDCRPKWLARREANSPRLPRVAAARTLWFQMSQALWRVLILLQRIAQ